MLGKRSVTTFLTAAALLLPAPGASAAEDAPASTWSDAENEPPELEPAARQVLLWHTVLLDSIAIDHTPNPRTGEAALEQPGPTRTSRATAMVTIAIFDAVNSFERKFVAYDDIGRPSPGASKEAAVAYAAHDVLVVLYPDQEERLDALLRRSLEKISCSSRALAAGRAIGEAAAEAILERREDDGSEIPDPDFGEGGRVADGTRTFFGKPVNNGTRRIGAWEPDPNSGDDTALGAFWGAVTPFVLERGDQFRLPPPPRIGTSAYIAAFDEVSTVGGSPENVYTPSRATPKTVFIGNYWSYDGTPRVGTPPRLYNQIVAQVAVDQGLTEAADLAQLFAVVNTGLADSGIAAWDSKYYYNWWRPITGIRRDDGVARTRNDPTWDPVGVSLVNTEEFVPTTPPFPAYPSGHATFGATVFETLRSYFGDDTPFTFVSDEYNGRGFDPRTNTTRPLVPVRFASFQQAQEQNGQSRIFNGVHWQYDNQNGQRLGMDVTDFLLNDVDAFQPLRDR